MAAPGRRRHLGEAVHRPAVAALVAVGHREQGDALLPEPRLARPGEAAGGPAKAHPGGRPGAHGEVVDAPDLERIGQRGLIGVGGDGVVGQPVVPPGQPVAPLATATAQPAPVAGRGRPARPSMARSSSWPSSARPSWYWASPAHRCHLVRWRGVASSRARARWSMPRASWKRPWRRWTSHRSSSRPATASIPPVSAKLLPGRPEVGGLGVDLGQHRRVEGVGQPVVPGRQEPGVVAGVGAPGGGGVPGRLQPFGGELPQQLVQAIAPAVGPVDQRPLDQRRQHRRVGSGDRLGGGRVEAATEH